MIIEMCAVSWYITYLLELYDLKLQTGPVNKTVTRLLFQRYSVWISTVSPTNLTHSFPIHSSCSQQLIQRGTRIQTGTS